MIKVNHVLSKNTYSSIFEAIFGYFEKFSDGDVQHYFSVEPENNMDVYHYHRPNISDEIFPNSFTTVHHDLLDTDPWLDVNKFIIKYKQIDRIICLNQTQSEILAGYEIYNTCVIPWGYNSKVFTKNIQNKNHEVDGRNRKISLGIFSKRYGRKVKGEALLYEIAKRLPADRFRFVFVGEGRMEDAYYFEKLGFETKVHEFLPYRIFGELYSAIDLLMITSFYEGGPANVPEAFAKGTPIISTPVGMAKDYVKHQTNGIILQRDPDFDSQEILKVLDCDYLMHLRKNANLMRRKMTTWQEVVQKYNKQYQNYIYGERLLK